VGVDEENPRRLRARELAARAAATGDETGWLETLYAEAEAGRSVVPWADGDANPHLVEWAGRGDIDGRGKRALAALPGPVAPAGTLLVVARATDDPGPARDPALMPWPLTQAELELAGGPLRPVRVEKFLDDEDPPKLRWRAEFRRG
jgi:hypothetical protein